VRQEHADWHAVPQFVHVKLLLDCKTHATADSVKAGVSRADMHMVLSTITGLEADNDCSTM